jgi:hypothetical protein
VVSGEADGAERALETIDQSDPGIAARLSKDDREEIPRVAFEPAFA